MVNKNEVTPEQREELASMIMEASRHSWFEAIRHDDDEKALILVDEIIKLGWRWDPPVTMENLNFNEVALKPTQEIEIMDRIISGLPVDNVPFIVEEYMEDQGEDLLKKYEGVKLYDVNSLYPQEVQIILKPKGVPKITYMENDWVRLPEFDNYEINPFGVIRSRWTRRELETSTEGNGGKYVEMHDKEGFAHYVSVDNQVKIVFGE